MAGVGAVVVTFAAWATPAIAQRYPLLDSTAVAMLSGEISGDAAYDHVRVLSGFHRPQYRIHQQRLTQRFGQEVGHTGVAASFGVFGKRGKRYSERL